MCSIPYERQCLSDSFSYHIKSRGIQGLVFMQIILENYTANFYFKNDKVGIKTKIPNL